MRLIIQVPCVVHIKTQYEFHSYTLSRKSEQQMATRNELFLNVRRIELDNKWIDVQKKIYEHEFQNANVLHWVIKRYIRIKL